MTVEFTLKDTGNVPATGTAPLTISLSTQPAGSNGASVMTGPLRVRLKPGQLKVYKLKVKVPTSTAAGAYYIAVSFDAQALGDHNPADGFGISSQPVTVG